MLYCFVDFHFVCIAEGSGSFAEGSAEDNVSNEHLVSTAEESGSFAEGSAEVVLFYPHRGRKRKVPGRLSGS